MAMLASAEFGALRADALLEVLALVPECGAFLSDGEVLAIQELLLEVLDHACSEAAPWPAKLPPAAAPTQRSAAYRGIATHCLGGGGAAEFEGVSLAMLAEAACWPALVAAVSGADGAAAQRAAAELCTAALEREPTVPADDALAAAAAAMTMPFVPQALQLSLLTGLCDALQPLANSAAVPPPNGADADGDDDDDDEAEGEAGGASGVALPGGGAAEPWLLGARCRSRSPPAALQLLRVLVLCSGHRRRRVCEALIASEVWTGERSLLRVAAGWAGEADLSAQLRDTLGATLRARAALPGDSTLARWGAADVEEWTTFRDSYLSEPLAELARADAVASVRHALEQLSLRAAMVDTTGDGQADTIVPKAAAPWQPLEASLFAVEAAAEVFCRASSRRAASASARRRRWRRRRRATAPAPPRARERLCARRYPSSSAGCCRRRPTRQGRRWARRCSRRRAAASSAPSRRSLPPTLAAPSLRRSAASSRARSCRRRWRRRRRRWRSPCCRSDAKLNSPPTRSCSQRTLAPRTRRCRR